MLQALTSPVFRAIAIGSLLLSVAIAGVATAKSRPRRMVLHAIERPGEIYFSAWRNGDLPLPFDGDQLVPLTYKTLASVSDGCRWLGIESLTPISERRYYYKYTEVILECDPGAKPLRKTPRTGCVTVED
jgi:hypothetical protein